MARGSGSERDDMVSAGMQSLKSSLAVHGMGRPFDIASFVCSYVLIIYNFSCILCYLLGVVFMLSCA